MVDRAGGRAGPRRRAFRRGGRGAAERGRQDALLVAAITFAAGDAASVRAVVEPQAAAGNKSASNAAATTTAEVGSPFARPAGRPAGDGWRWAVRLLAGTAAVIVLLIAMVRSPRPRLWVTSVNQTFPATSALSSPRLGNSMPAAPVPLPGPAAAENQKQVADSGGNSQPAAGKGSGGEPEKPVPAAKAAEPAVTEPPVAEPPAKDRDAELRAKLDGAVFTIEVEKGAGASRSSWPFATCVAVGDKVLLTTAHEAAQLAEWRQQKTFDKIWVTRRSAGVKEEVEDIRVAADYAAAPETTDDWIYVNLGLLTVRNKLPAVASLALPEELAKLKLGTSVACFGFSPAAKVITEEDAYKPLLSARRGAPHRRSNLPGQPWRLGLQGAQLGQAQAPYSAGSPAPARHRADKKPARPPFENRVGHGHIPTCCCGGRLRPHIVWFGEVPLDMDAMARARAARNDRERRPSTMPRPASARVGLWCGVRRPPRTRAALG